MFLGPGARSKTSVRQKLVLKLSAALVNTTPTDGSVSASKLAASAMGSGVSMINGTLSPSVAGSALTVALKTLNGTDPTSTDPIYVVVRNAAASNGVYTVLTITSAISFTLSSGSTIGSSNGTAFRVWLVCFDDAGTPRLSLINCLVGVSGGLVTYPLGQFSIATANAEGGAGGADGAGTFYASVNITSKAYAVLGYFTWETGLATAGTWSAGPTRTELFRPWTPLPGALLQTAETRTGAVATGTTTIPFDDTIPQSSEGDQYMTAAITPSSAANVLRVQAQASFAISVADRIIMALFQDAAANALASGQAQLVTAGVMQSVWLLDWSLLAATTSSTTFKIRAGSVLGSDTTTFNGSSGGRQLGGSIASHLRAQELQA